MENTPQNFEDNSENTDKKDSKKKKKAERLGSLLVTPKAENKNEAKDQEKTKKSEHKAEETSQESGKNPESSNSLENLSEEEKQFVEREYVQSYRSESREAPESPEEAAADEAVKEFHGYIEEGVDSEEAYAATMSHLGSGEDLNEEVDSQKTKSEDSNRVTRGFNRLVELIVPSKEDSSKDDSSRTVEDGSPLDRHKDFIQGFNFVPHPAEPANVEPSSERVLSQQENVSANPVTSAMLGGVIDYLVGRRSGRVDSEKKLLPIQKKLQKQVIELGWKLGVKEEAIRQTARKQAYIEKRYERPVKQEIRNTAPRASEHLGHMIVKSEEVIYARSEATSPSPVEVAPKITKHVEKLSRFELLELSRKVRIDGTSLRQIYDSHLIGEKGLRRLMGEHMRGGDIKKALRRELVQREIDFERDPVLRDQDIRHVDVLPKADQLENLIQKASSALPYTTGSNLYYETQEKPQENNDKQISKEKIIDASLISTILILTVAVLILLARNY